MRQIVLDTETTGLQVQEGDRVVQIGCVELLDRRQVETFTRYVNPECEISEDAFRVHGISLESLRDHPPFKDVADELLAFLQDSELIIHSAAFDLAFLNSELKRAGHEEKLEECHSIVDTLSLARKMHPGQRNNLDALCRRYLTDHTDREQHSALQDAELLARVYLAMTGGQVAMKLDSGATLSDASVSAHCLLELDQRPPVIPPTDDELEAHQRRMEQIEQISHGRNPWKP